MDSLPPRPAQPLLYYSRYPANLGSKSFEPMTVIKQLHRLDELILGNRKLLMANHQPLTVSRCCLHRDVYICEWLSVEGSTKQQQQQQQRVITLSSRTDYFPVFMTGGRPTLSSEEGECYLNIGILHAPQKSATLAMQAGPSRLATLTLLPPEPHILLPLLIRAAEAEYRALKRLEDAAATSGTKPASKLMVPIDENWRNEFRAYLFRLPPYYQHALKRSLRTVLPQSAHTLLHTDTMESIALQCFSKTCLQKIRNGEQVARDTVERLDLQEASLKRENPVQGSSNAGTTGTSPGAASDGKPLRYGQYDPRSSVESYLSALRCMPPPWRVKKTEAPGTAKSKDPTKAAEQEAASAPKTAVDFLGDLPSKCMMAYYESRRRWLFGGPSLSCRGLLVEGVPNDGSNSQRCGAKSRDRVECPLSLAKVGVSTLNETTTTKMGDYRERLLYTRSPVVGYGMNDAAGVAATTAVDGSPVWSVDDDAMPMTFFDPKTGEFADSVQARVRSRLYVNFGNPYKEKRADSLIPSNFLSQAPSMQQGGVGVALGIKTKDSGAEALPMGPRTPPVSPPHDSFDSVEEGEAIFVRKSPSRSSPKREDADTPSLDPPPPPKRPRSDSVDSTSSETTTSSIKSTKSDTMKSPPPPPSIDSKKAPPPPKPSKAPSLGKAPPPGPPGKRAPPPKRAAPPPKHRGPPAPPKRPPAPGRKGSMEHAPPPPKPTPKQPPPRPKLAPAAAPPPPLTATTSGSSTSSTGTSDSGKKPPAPPGPATLKRVSSTSSTGNTSTGSNASLSEHDLQSPDKKPNVDLPAGWICVWSKSQRRWYFFDTRSNKSVWKWPP